MGLSALCLVHCLLIPVLLGFMPVLAETFIQHEHFHLVMVGFVLPVAALGLIPGYLRTRQVTALRWGFAGLFLLTAAALGGHEMFGERLEMVVSVIGATCLFRAHWLNHAAKCKCPHGH